MYVILYILNEGLYISMNATVRFSLVGIFTVRNSSCGKEMILHLSVILFTVGLCGRGACRAAGGIHGRGVWGVYGGHACQGVPTARGRGHAWLRGLCMAGTCVHGRRDGQCSGRYTSYWNTFLLPVVTSHSLS